MPDDQFGEEQATSWMRRLQTCTVAAKNGAVLTICEPHSSRAFWASV